MKTYTTSRFSSSKLKKTLGGIQDNEPDGRKIYFNWRTLFDYDWSRSTHTIMFKSRAVRNKISRLGRFILIDVRHLLNVERLDVQVIPEYPNNNHNAFYKQRVHDLFSYKWVIEQIGKSFQGRLCMPFSLEFWPF